MRPRLTVISHSYGHAAGTASSLVGRSQRRVGDRVNSPASAAPAPKLSIPGCKDRWPGGSVLVFAAGLCGVPAGDRGSLLITIWSSALRARPSGADGSAGADSAGTWADASWMLSRASFPSSMQRLGESSAPAPSSSSSEHLSSRLHPSQASGCFGDGCTRDE